MFAESAMARPTEQAEKNGEEVYSLHWLNEWGGGVLRILRWRGRYYTLSSDDVDPGPFPSLEEALARGAGCFGHCEVEITCTALPAPLLVLHLTGHDDGQVIRINGRQWRATETGEWEPVS